MSKKKLVSLLLAVCMLVSLLPAGMLAGAAEETPLVMSEQYLFLPGFGNAELTVASDHTGVTLTSNTNEDLIVVTETDSGFAIEAKLNSDPFNHTAKLVFTADDGSEAAVYVYVNQDYTYYYDLTKGFTGPNSTNVIAYADMGYEDTFRGSPRDVTASGNRYFYTDPWRAGSIVGDATVTTDSSFPIGPAGTTYEMRGYAMNVTAEGSSVSYIVNVPQSNDYTPYIVYQASPSYGTVDVAIGETAVGTIDMSNTVAAEHKWIALDPISLTAGEHEVIFSNATSGARIKAIVLAGDYNGYLECADLKNTGVELIPGEIFTPEYTNSGYGDVTDGLFYTSDPNVASVDEKTGEITAVAPGTAVIAMGTSAGYDYDFMTVVVAIPAKLTYNYLTSYKAAFPDQVPKSSTEQPPNGLSYLISDYATDFSLMATRFASTQYGWKVGPKSDAAGNWVYSSSAKTMGPYFSTGSAGVWNSIIIDVPIAGDYIVSTSHSPWTAGSHYDMYIAPTDASDYMAAEYKVNGGAINHVSTTNKLTETYAGKITLAAGENVVTYCAAASGTGLFIGGINLYRADTEMTATSLTLTNPTNAMIPLGTSLGLTTATAPIAAAGYATYSSSDNEIATVDENGVVTAKAAGTVTITATLGDLTATCDVVCAEPLDYKFNDVAKAIGGGTTAVNFVSPLYPTDYDDATVASVGSAPWITVRASVGFSGGTTAYGIFMFGTYGGVDDVGIKVKLEAGQYSAGMVVNEYGNSTDTNIYIAPVEAASYEEDAYLIMDYNVTHTGTVAKKTVYGDKVLNLPAGEYYVTFRQTDATSVMRYLTLDTFSLYRIGEYETPEVGSVSVSVDNDTLAVGDTATATAIVAPLDAEQGVVWSSSNEEIATVDNGVVTALTNGVVTITATSVENSEISDSVTLLIGEAAYDYNFVAVGAARIADGSTSYLLQGVTDYTTDGGSDPWMFVFATNNFQYNTVWNNTVLMFNTNPPTSGDKVQIKIRVDADGVYHGVFNYKSYNGLTSFDVYVAPEAAEDPMAEEYHYMFVSNANRSSASHTASVPTSAIGEDQLALKAGNYVVTIYQNASGAGRYLPSVGFSLYKAADMIDDTVIETSTIEGAAIRLREPQGLRFKSTITKNDDFGKVKEYGTVLLPTADLDGDINNLVLGYTATNGNAVAKVLAVNKHLEDDTSVTFTAVLINVAPENYARAITARTYVIYEDDYGYEHTVYGSTSTSRSILEVANAILASDTATEAEKAAAEEIINAYNAAIS